MFGVIHKADSFVRVFIYGIKTVFWMHRLMKMSDLTCIILIIPLNYFEQVNRSYGYIVSDYSL